jgi:phage terminase large subunit-like protein
MINLENLLSLPAHLKIQAIQILEQRKKLEQARTFDKYYPDDGPNRRELYHKHTAFFVAGAQYRERLFIAANRVGKSEGVGGYELTLHLSGLYPEWWQGKRFDRPVSAWASGDTAKTTRDIIQRKLLGPSNDMGSGLIPRWLISGKPLSKPGVPEAVEIVKVKHVSGGVSTLILKSYDQRREAFQGTEQDIIWLDEEPPYNIYVECLMRTMTTDGSILCTFTPLQGLSETVLHYLPNGKIPEKTSPRYVITATWDDAPHLTTEQKEELWASIPPYQRDSRTKGIPQLGSGAIYPLSEDDISCDPFDMPYWWPRAFGFDVGWNRTAALWGAWDRDSDIVYLYSEHYQGQAEPLIHSHAIQSRGDWIPGAIDPAANGRTQVDGKQLMAIYQDLGLMLAPADNSVEAGIYAVWQRLSTGRLKVFNTLRNWFDEYRLYRRDENGKIVKDRDHLMDATRYLIMTGLGIAQSEPRGELLDMQRARVGRSAIAGY